MNNRTGLDINWNIGKPSLDAPNVEAKKARVEMSTAQKLASFGSPAEKRVIATAINQGNDIAQDQGLQDFQNMDPLSYALKYGDEAAQGFYGLNDAVREVEQIKSRDRSTAQMLGDSAIDAGNIAASMLGGTAALGALASDAAFDTQVSPRISAGVDWFREQTQGLQSDAFQDRREQHAIEAELNRVDRQNRYDAALEENPDAIAPWFQKQGQAVVDTVANYGDDGMMLTSLAAESLGSLAPQALAAKVLGRAAAKQALKNAGRSGSEATAFLKTAAGKEFLNRHTQRAALASVTASETGAAVQQAQGELMSMDVEELRELPEFQTHLENGMSEEQARRQLAVDAGTIAAPAAAPLALGAGAIASRVVANPLGRGEGAESILGNLGRETLEEALQEGNSTVAANLGIREQGIDRALDEGVAEAATQGAMGGAMSVATLQSPAAAIDAVASAGKLAAGGAKAAVQARKDAVERKADAASATGSKAQAESNQAMTEIATQVEATEAARAVEAPEAAEPTEAPAVDEAVRAEVSNSINRAVLLSDDEVNEQIQAGDEYLKELKEANPDRRLSRKDLMDSLARTISNSEEHPLNRAASSIEYLRHQRTLQSAASTRNVEFVDSLTDDDNLRGALSGLQKHLAVEEGSTHLKQAKAMVGAMSPDHVKQILPPEVVTAPDLPIKDLQEYAAMLEVIRVYNPKAVDKEAYNITSDQLGSDEVRARLLKKMAASADIIAALEENVETKAQIDADMKEQGASFKTSDIVADEVAYSGNTDNQMPSLAGHQRLVSEAAMAGNTRKATALLKDLADFAQSQANKVGAFNVSAQRGDGKKVPYMAHGPFGQFLRNEPGKGVFFDAGNPSSAGLVREVRAEADTAARLVKSLAAAYDLEAPSIRVPALNGRIMSIPAAPSSLKAVQTKAANNQPIIPPGNNGSTDPVVDEAQAKLKELREAQKAASELRKRDTGKNPLPRALQRSLTKQAGGKRPLLLELKSRGGIDPKSDVGKELINAGLERAQMPGLFRKDGLTQLDNLPASEMPFLAQMIGESNGYLDLNGLLDAIMAEAAGTPQHVRQEQYEAFLELEARTEERDAQKALKAKAEARPKPKAKEAPKQEETNEQESQETSEEPDEQEAADEEASTEEEAPQARAALWFESLKDLLVTNFKGVSNFLNSFRLKSDLGTNFFHDTDNPAEWLLQDDTLNALTKDEVTQDALRTAVTNGLDDFRTFMDKAKEARLSKLKEGDKVSKVLRFADGMSLNLGSMEDGIFEFDDMMLQAAFFSGMEWMLDTATPPREMDADEINRMFGKPRGSAVTEAEAEAARTGDLSYIALKKIADNMQRFLGVEANKDADLDYTQGMFRAMAGNVMQFLKESGKLKEFETKEGANTIIAVRGDETALTDSEAILQKYRELFTRAFLGEKAGDFLVGAPADGIRATQLGNRFAKISRKEREVIERLQNMPSYVNEPMAGLVDALGEDLFMDLMGRVDLSTEELRSQYNERHLKKLEGKNQTITHDTKNTLSYLAQARAENLPIYFRFAISSVGRLQQMGPVTPQGSKIMRELVAATNSTLDLSGQNPEHERAFWLAVGQSLGTKIELLSTDAARAKTESTLQMWQPVLDMLEGHFSGSAPLEGEAFLEAVQSIGSLDAKGLHALVTMARYNVASSEERAAFQTALAVEADGKTDGPINAMVHMSTGRFTPTQIARLAKGGLFFSDEPISLNEYIALEKEVMGKDKDGNELGGHDLYQETVKLFHAKLKDAVSSGSDNRQQDAVLRIMNAFLPDFTYVPAGTKNDDGTVSDTPGFEIGRNVVKNPLTVFIYGSGEAGIANKLTGAVADVLAERFSAAIQNKKSMRLMREMVADPELEQAMADVMFNGNKGSLNDWLARTNVSQVRGQVEENLRNAIEHNFVTPMLEAVDEATGGMRSQMQFIQAASRVQQIVFKDVFQRNLNKAIAAKEAEAAKNKKPGERVAKPLLSENELNDVFLEAMKIAPIYSTDAQSFHIAQAVPVTRDNNRDIGASLNGRFSSRPTFLDAAEASVKVSPYMTIGTGDGRMILNIYADGNVDLDTSLPVFDGVELALDKMASASQQINEQTLAGWLEGNPYTAIADGFDLLVQNLRDKHFDLTSEDALSQEAMDALRRTLYMAGPNGGKREQRPADLGTVRNIATSLRAMSNMAQARKEAMKSMGISADHMAGAQAPAFREGDVTVTGNPTDFAGIAEMLETRRRSALERITTEQKVKLNSPREAKYAQKPTAGMQARIDRFTTEVEGFKGVRTATADRAALILQKGSGATNEQLQIFRDLESLAPMEDDTVFYFGDAKELTRLRDSLYPNAAEGEIELGQSLYGGRVMFIANAAPETMLHEMLHGYTLRTLVKHFRNPEGSTEQVKFAVARLEEALQDFMQIRDYATYGPERGSALAHVQAQISVLQGNRAAQLGELIAYSLSNQDLIELGKKTKTYRPLMSLVQKALQAIRKLLHFKNPGDTFFSNMRFNTLALVDPGISQDVDDTATEDDMTIEAMNQTFGTDERLERIEQVYLTRLRKLAKSATATGQSNMPEVGKAISRMRGDLVQAERAGFVMNFREANAFAAVHATLKSGVKLSAGLQRQMTDAMSVTMENLTPELLLAGQGIDAPTENQKAQAERMIRHLTNVRGNPNQSEIFTALTMSHGGLRAALDMIQMPKDRKVHRSDSIGDWFNWIAEMAMNLLTRASLNPRKAAPTVRAELDRLAGQLEHIQEERKFFAVARKAGEWVDWANEQVSTQIEDKSLKAARLLEKKSSATQSDFLKTVYNIGEMAMNMGSSAGAEANGDFATRFFDSLDGWDTMRQLVSDLRGMTKENAPLLRMLNPVRAKIDALRQAYRDGTPSDLQDLFKTRKPTDEEWRRMHKGIAQADLLALDHSAAMSILKDPSQVSKLIAEQEEALQKLGGSFTNRYKSKAKALAHYMVTGENTSMNLLANAEAIAHLLNEQGSKKLEIQKAATPKLIEAIDKLTSLYAFDGLDQAVKDTLAELASAEPDAMSAVSAYLATVRKLEKGRRTKNQTSTLQKDDMARFNGWKGYVPASPKEGSTVVVREDIEQRELERIGYKRVADYPGNSLEAGYVKRGYYVSTVAGRPIFNQGVVQTVHDTWQGVSLRNGRTNGLATSGAISGQDAQDIADYVKTMGRRNLDNLIPGAHMIPRFNGLGQIVSYELAVEADKQALVPKDDHLGRMLGVWMGRILEENAADAANREVVGVLHGIYTDAKKAGNLDGFVNVAKSKDPIIKDAWNTLGDRVKEDLQDAFGVDGVMIRKSMLEDALGSRMPSITDSWTGTSRWSPEAQKGFRSFLNDFVGDDAFKWLKQGEGAVQEAVGFAKTTIIVRSIKVAWDNILSNMLHLQTLGVGPIKFFREGRQKLIEINQYLSNRDKRRQLEIRLAQNLEKPAERRQIENQLSVLDRADAKLSIKPLIDAGEFSSISENLTEQDMAMRDGKLIQYVSKLTDKLPARVKEAGKYAMITKDTELFKAMNRMVQYGDFVAKAVLYDHEMAKEDADQRQVLDKIFEEFVAYNRGSGRTRSYVESVGLGWFWSYKLRIMKVLHRTLRERPVSAMFMMGGVGPALDVQSVYDGSLLGAGLDGRLPFSVGPEMGLQAANLHPVFGALR